MKEDSFSKEFLDTIGEEQVETSHISHFNLPDVDNEMVVSKSKVTFEDLYNIDPQTPQGPLETESCYDIIDKMEVLGFKFFDKGTMTDLEYETAFADELNNAFDSYKKMLLGKPGVPETDWHLGPQATIDYYISYALDQSKAKNPSENVVIFIKTVKKVILERIKNNDPLLFGTILYERPGYLKWFFEGEELQQAINYGKNAESRVIPLLNKWYISSETPIEDSDCVDIKYSTGNLSEEEKIIMFKALESGLFDKSYKSKIDIIERILIYRLEQKKEPLSRVELEWLMRKTAKDKCLKNGIKYVKPYIAPANLDFNKREENKMCPGEGEFIKNAYGIHFGSVGLVLITTLCHAEHVIPVTLHEYEHLIQYTRTNKNILDNQSLHYTLHSITYKNVSTEDFNEYDVNYKNKKIEIYANEKAKKEYHEILRHHKIKENPQLLTVSSRGREFAVINYNRANGTMLTPDHQRHPNTTFDLEMLEEYYKKTPGIIISYPILVHFINDKEKRLKNLTELAQDYGEQNITGRVTFELFVEHQVRNGDLKNVDLGNMDIVQRTTFVLMIIRNISSLLARIGSAMYLTLDKKDEHNYTSLIPVLYDEIDFLKDNIQYLDEIRHHILFNSNINFSKAIIKNEDRNRYLPISDSEKKLMKAQIDQEFLSPDNDIETVSLFENRYNVKSTVLNLQANPLYLMNLYTSTSVSKLITMSIGAKIAEKIKVQRRIEALPEEEPDKMAM